MTETHLSTEGVRI